MNDVAYSKAEMLEETYPVAFAAINNNDKARKGSSSGGIFLALAEYALSNNGVVYGCAFNGELEPEHIRCETIDECKKCCGSKYSQSNMRNVFSGIERDISEGRIVLFSGTPCQVDAVRKAFGGIGGSRLLLVDLICHGVPSPKLFSEHLRYLATVFGENVASYAHRPKTHHVGGAHKEEATLSDGRVMHDCPEMEVWKNLFYSNKFLRPSCYACPYTSTRRKSDITIADYWGLGRSSAAHMRDKLGVSLVLVNTALGDRVWDLLDVSCVETPIAEALPGNPMLERPSACQNREKAWRSLYEEGYSSMIKRYGFKPKMTVFLKLHMKRKIIDLITR